MCPCEVLPDRGIGGRTVDVTSSENLLLLQARPVALHIPSSHQALCSHLTPTHHPLPCQALNGALLVLVASAAASLQNPDLVLVMGWTNCFVPSPLCCCSPQVLSCPRHAYLAVLCQQLDVALIDHPQLLQLTTAQLPPGDISVVDFGAQLLGQDSQGFSLWRQSVEHLRKEKAKRVLRREEQKDGAERAGVKAPVQGAWEDACSHGAEQMMRKETCPGQSRGFSGCSAQGAERVPNNLGRLMP